MSHTLALLTYHQKTEQMGVAGVLGTFWSLTFLLQANNDSVIKKQKKTMVWRKMLALQDMVRTIAIITLIHHTYILTHNIYDINLYS